LAQIIGVASRQRRRRKICDDVASIAFRIPISFVRRFGGIGGPRKVVQIATKPLDEAPFEEVIDLETHQELVRTVEAECLHWISPTLGCAKMSATWPRAT